jgi:glycosyltransferase involved in cell wall biosynthesis
MILGKKISLVIPCYNEENGLKKILANDLSFFDQVIVVDNNCIDNTAEVARTGGCQIAVEKKKGYGAAYKCGFAAATGELIVTMDGDNTYPVREVKRLVHILTEQGLDFLSANRLGEGKPQHMTSTNYLGNLILTLATKILFWQKIKDSQSGMWVFRRELLAKMDLRSDGMAFSQEIKLEAIKCGFKFGEADISYDEREGIVKLNKWKDGFLNLAFLIYKRVT